ncbi:hypothetical protein D3C75_1010180 [compost metagenome]
MFIIHTQFGYQGPQALGNLNRRVWRRIGQQDGELLAAQPAGNVVVTQAGTDRCTDALQHLVASGMPERVVDLFEMVDVQHQHGHECTRIPALGVLRRSVVEKSTSVVQAGQFVRARGHHGKPMRALHFVFQAPGRRQCRGQALRRADHEPGEHQHRQGYPLLQRRRLQQ